MTQDDNRFTQLRKLDFDVERNATTPRPAYEPPLGQLKVIRRRGPLKGQAPFLAKRPFPMKPSKPILAVSYFEGLKHLIGEKPTLEAIRTFGFSGQISPRLQSTSGVADFGDDDD